MSGVLTLSYWALANRTPVEERVRVSNQKPPGIDVSYSYPALYPDKNTIFYPYKRGEIDWEVYAKRYINQLYTTGHNELWDMLSKLQDGKDLTIFCYESSAPCHRFIIGELAHRLGHKVLIATKNGTKEFTKDDYIFMLGDDCVEV